VIVVFISPHWQNVIPFALTSFDQFRSPTGPPTYGSARFLEQAQDLVEISANLTDEQKAIAEYWSDGPGTATPPGHWNLFSQFVSRRDRHGAKERGVDLDVKMYFALNAAVFDASIAAWDDRVSRSFSPRRLSSAGKNGVPAPRITGWTKRRYSSRGARSGDPQIAGAS
jgi:hypothetical protein